MVMLPGRLYGGGIVAGFLVAACSSSGVCPTIGCFPTVTMTYANPVSGDYTLSVSVAGMTLQASCPSTLYDSSSPVVERCDQTGFEISGVDLGHGANESLPLTVSINGGASLSAGAELGSITNSRDCDLVCYQHTGVIEN